MDLWIEDAGKGLNVKHLMAILTYPHGVFYAGRCATQALRTPMVGLELIYLFTTAVAYVILSTTYLEADIFAEGHGEDS